MPRCKRRRQTVGFAFAPLRLFLHHWHAGPVHLHIRNRNRLTHDDGQIQLDGSTDLALFTLGDVSADRLCRALHRLGGYLQSGQHFHLLPAVIEESLLTHQSLHAAHPRREVGVLDIQLDIGWKRTLMAMRTQIPGTLHPRQAHHGEHRPGAEFLVGSLMSTGARQLTPIRPGSLESQQFTQGAGPGLVKSRSQSRLQCFQIRATGVPAFGEDAAQQCCYLPRDLDLDGAGRFFSSAVSVSSTGRRQQTCPLTSTSSSLSF